MPKLNDKPNSSSKKQHQAMVIAGLSKGFDVHELRKMVGGSLRRLSVREASDWLIKLTGNDLPNPPGEKPRDRSRKATPGVTRMITPDHVEQIDRLLMEYFGDIRAGLTWLQKYHDAATARELGTAERAGQIITTLKTMLDRRASETRPI